MPTMECTLLGFPAEVEYQYNSEERQRHDPPEPGCPEHVEILNVMISVGGNWVDVPDPDDVWDLEEAAMKHYKDRE
jgi:hypothetical protein